jgi:hypothetical protein
MTNNQYPEETLQKISRSQKKKNYNFQNNNQDNIKKWATFTYIGRETRNITKIFKTTNLKIAFKTTNTIQNHLCNLKEPNHQKNPYQNSGLYQLTCKEYNQKYIGQTGRTFKTRYNEHINAIKSNKLTSRYAQHILDNQHSYGTIHDTMDILRITKEGQHMNTLERYHIYKNKKTYGNILNDTYAEAENPIFEVIH